MASPLQGSERRNVDSDARPKGEPESDEDSRSSAALGLLERQSAFPASPALLKVTGLTTGYNNRRLHQAGHRLSIRTGGKEALGSRREL